MNNNENIHNIVGDYKFGFTTDVKNVVDTGKGLTEDVVRQISKLKNEPEWMLEFRLKAYKKFIEMPLPSFGPDLSFLNKWQANTYLPHQYQQNKNDICFYWFHLKCFL